MPAKRAIDGDRAFQFRENRLYVRRAKINEGFLQSLTKKIRKGEYVHRETTGDVEVYDIAEWSPMRRHRRKLGEMTLKQVENVIIVAACEYDWKLYRDASEEYAFRFLNGGVSTSSGDALDLATAQAEFKRMMAYLEDRIDRRGGPGLAFIRARLQELEAKKRGRKIVLPGSA